MATLLLITASVAAFAMLGEGGKKGGNTKRGLLSYNPSYNYKNFSLKTGYQYRGSIVFKPYTPASKYIIQETNITYQRGNATYILPLKRKVLLDKVKFSAVRP